MTRWSIGAFARACGVTVRTLHHYDQIGLLRPADRTPAGHRRYTEPDLRRLYRIRALRGLGLSLDEIATLLAGRPDDPAALRDVLRAQLRGVDDQVVRLGEIRNRITGLIDQLDAHRMPGLDQFLATLELMSLYETYFTAEQRDHLARHRDELGSDALDQARADWIALVDDVPAARRRRHTGRRSRRRRSSHPVGRAGRPAAPTRQPHHSRHHHSRAAHVA